MLEILMIVFLSKKIAAIVKEKGRKPAGYIVAFVLLWFGGEFFGAIVGSIIVAARNPGFDGSGFNPTVYLVALMGATIGATIGYVFPILMPPLERDDDDEEDRPRRRRRRDEEDEADDDRPRRRRREDDDEDEEEDRPRRRSGRRRDE